MANTLVIVTHPHMDQSLINKRWVEELKKHPDEFTVHELYDEYPNGIIDVAQEQELIKEHKNIVLQFPVYWFNSPPLLKEWLDKVLTFGWAYGPGGEAFIGKNLGIAVSLGGAVEGYKPTGAVGYTIEETLRPFELVAHYIRANHQPLFAFYGAAEHSQNDQDWEREVEASSDGYLEHLRTYYI